MGDRLAELDGVEVSRPTSEDEAAAERVAEQLADLVEPTKVLALEKVDEEERAVPIALGWLRSRRDRRASEAEAAPTR